MFTINKRLIGLADICEKDTTSNIGKVYCKNQGEKVITVATDGHLLLEITTSNKAIDYPSVDLSQNKEYSTTLIPANKWKSILKTIPKNHSHPILSNTLISPQKGNGAEIGVFNFESVQKTIIQGDEIQGDEIQGGAHHPYPEYEYLLKPKEKETVIKLDPKLLGKLISTLITMEVDYVNLHFTEDPHNAIRITSTNPHEDMIQGVIMPLRKD